MPAAQYCVLDLETTGLFPGRHDRVIEVAAVLLDESANVVDEYSTLVNPGRDVGPTSIHGITAHDVTAAPPFGAIASDLIDRLRGRIIVGHNVGFDLRFLDAELRRLGGRLPSPEALCTMQLMQKIRPGLPSHRLECCCAASGIVAGSSHSAMADARASSALLRANLPYLPGEVVSALLCSARAVANEWPHFEAGATPLPRGSWVEPNEKPLGYLRDLLTRVPVVGAPVHTGSYLALLERALDDFTITRSEVEALAEVAVEAGLGPLDVHRLHESYLRSLVSIAWADGVITRTERSELLRMAAALGFSEADVDRLAAEAGATEGSSQPLSSEEYAGQSADHDMRGATVCFTGELQASFCGERISRSTAEVLATSGGLVVVRSVSKKLDILVMADPDSNSTKARKAREYGTRLMAESAFWRRIGAPVDGLGAR